MAIVELSKVMKRYGDVLAVQDFNLTTTEGEFVVLVGPSGCGKTTTMRMIAGLETVTGGEIKIGGKNVVGMIPRERDVAMVFQNYALFPHMNVFGNMSFGLRLRKFPPRTGGRTGSFGGKNPRYRTPARPETEGTVRG